MESENKKSSSFRGFLFLFAGIVIFAWFGPKYIGKNPAPVDTKQPEMAYSPKGLTPDYTELTQEQIKILATERTSLEITSWQKEAYNVAMVDFKISNRNDYPVKDIKISCDVYAKSGTKLGANERTIYDIVDPKKSKTFNDFNMGFINSQAEKIGCKIVEVNL